MTATFDFGWDNTPGVYRHDGTYSLVVKDNYYVEGTFFVTQLDADLHEEWEFEATNTLACERLPDGTVSCEDFGFPFEWCIASPGVDRHGTVHVVSADGNLYAIGQGGVEQGRLFLDHTAFAAYTPTAIDREGQPFWWPEADQALFQSIRNWISPGVKVIELDSHINDPDFARTAAETLKGFLGR